MKRSHGNNAVLIELVIVLFFFILSFAVLAQIFAGAYVTEERAQLQTRALHEARNMNALLYAAEDRSSFLSDREGQWAYDGFDLSVSLETEKTAVGTLERWQVKVLQEGQEMFSLPGACYVGEVVSDE